MKHYPIYKGLQKPLVYRGFKGKFIAWGISSLAIGLIIGGLTGAILNMYLGGVMTILSMSAGLGYTFHKQKSGLHDKARANAIFIHRIKLRRGYGKARI